MNRRHFIQTGTSLGLSLLWPRHGLAFQGSRPSTGATVDTTAGKVQGLLLTPRVHAFRGIPYGASTAGRRFLPPLPAAPWTGVREAFDIGARSPLVDSRIVAEFDSLNPRERMGEDCLVLNVWTPNPDRARRPVMVWLHGGGYAAGSAGWTCYDGRDLARKHDVVVVGVNHRLNAFGFLHLAELGGEAYREANNQGLRDIVLALQWVRDNIAAFGGDASNVTLFGQSGGAGKVSHMLGVPSARGLFHKAIVQSGSAVTSQTSAAATRAAEQLLSALQLTPGQIDRLASMPMEQVLAALRPRNDFDERSRAQAPTPSRGGGGFQAAPVVDGTFLPSSVFAPAASAISAAVPMMIGSTETEVTWNVATDFTEPDAAGLRARVAKAVGVDAAAADHIIEVYRAGRPKASALDLALIIETDVSNFRTGTDLQAERKAAAGGAPVYMYRFQWYTPVGGGRLRSMHCLDIPFVFDNVDACATITGRGADRQPLADRMSAAWVAFARTGTPNHPGIPTWTPFSLTGRETMMFGNDTRAQADPYRAERLLTTTPKIARGA